MYDDQKFKSLHIMSPWTSAYAKSYDRQTKYIIFWLKMMTYWKKIILFGIKSALISKKETESKSVYNKCFLKTKVKSHGNEITDF